MTRSECSCRHIRRASEHPEHAVVITDLAIDLGVVFAVTMFGALAARAMLRGATGLELAGLAFPLGGGLLTFTAFLASWAGIPLSLISVGTLWVLLITVAALANRPPRLAAPKKYEGPRQVEVGNAGRGHWSRREWPVRVSLAIFVLMSVLAAVIAIGRAHSSYDAAAMWIVKGYGIAQEGSIFGAQVWGAHALAYPLNIHLLVMLFRLTTADQVPGSQLIFLMFYCSTALTVLAYWVRREVAPLVCGLGLLFLASVPVLLLHSTIAFPNLPMAFFVVSGAIYGMEGLAGGRKGSRLLGGILLGMGSWTIIEGFQYSAVVLVLVVLAAAWDSRPRLSEYVLLAAPYLLITGIWLVFYNRYGASGSQAVSAFNTMLVDIRAGDYNLVELRLIFGYMRRYLFEVKTWGVLFSVGGVILLLGVPKLRDSLVPEAFTLMLLFAGTAALTCALFYLRSFVTSDFLAWLIRGFPRGFLAPAIFFAMTVVLVGSPADSPATKPGGTATSA